MLHQSADSFFEIIFFGKTKRALSHNQSQALSFGQNNNKKAEQILKSELRGDLWSEREESVGPKFEWDKNLKTTMMEMKRRA